MLEWYGLVGYGIYWGKLAFTLQLAAQDLIIFGVDCLWEEAKFDYKSKPNLQLPSRTRVNKVSENLMAASECYAPKWVHEACSKHRMQISEVISECHCSLVLSG